LDNKLLGEVVLAIGGCELMDIRLLETNEWQDAILLADQTFREAREDSMGDAFPHIFSPSLKQSYGLFIEGRLVAFIGLVPAIVRVGPARLQVFSVGSVCTAYDQRGKGYAPLLLDHVLQHVQNSEASLLLVSGSISLYSRRDCYRYGTFMQFTLEPASAEELLNSTAIASQAYVFRELNSSDWFRLKQLADNRAVAFEQSLWDIASLIHYHTLATNRKLDSKVLVAEKAGQMLAYSVVAITNPQSDPAQISRLIEWGGDPVAATALMAYAVKQYVLAKLFANVGWYESVLSQSLKSTATELLKDDFTIRIMDTERLLLQLKPFLEEKQLEWSCSLHIKRMEDGSYHLQIGKLERWITAKELVALVFNVPNEQSELNNEELKSLFPIPFPHGAGLNYL
jgi:predicted N-acetyltransferase YhbS